MLPMVQKMWFNKLDRPENQIADLSRREMMVLGPLVAFMILMGVYPKPFLEKSEVTVMQLLQTVEARRSVPGAISLNAPERVQP